MHECCFLNSDELFAIVLKHSQDTLPAKFLASYLNAKTTD
jgi:peptide deformylase